jgi:DNA-binding transcriptional MerR regulator
VKQTQANIPDKLYFRIGEVSDLVGVKPYVLRYWESEFQDIHPTKSKSGQRLYRRRDVEVLMAIQTLLYEERFTINGARKRLKEVVRSEGNVETASRAAVVQAPAKPKKRTATSAQPELFTADEELFEDDPLTAGAPHTPDQRKVFVKLKKDLEFLLAELKAQ